MELGLHEEAPHKADIQMLLNSWFEFVKNVKVKKYKGSCSHLNAMCHPGLGPGLGLGDIIRDSIETIDGNFKRDYEFNNNVILMLKFYDFDIYM